ncbi:MAG: sialidase family protein [Pirellulaceae bacterium]
MMHVEARSIIYDAPAQPEAERVAFFDSLLRLESGKWLSGFTAGQTKHHHQAGIRLARSRDGGASWELLPWKFTSRIDGMPGSLTGAEMVEVQRGRLLLFTTWFDRSEPDRPLFDPQTEGILHSRQLMAVSTDDGDTWSDWRVVPTPGLSGCAITGPVLQWPDGPIAFAFESFKEFDDPSPPRHGSWIIISRDGGEFFETPLLIAQDPAASVYYWDQRLCLGASPGEIIGMFWTHDRAERRDLRVHLARGQLGDARRMKPIETTIPGQIAAPLLWPDGRLLAFVVDRAQPGTLRLWSSSDGGATWPEADYLTVHVHHEQAKLSQGLENIDFAQYWEDMAKWSFGHPAIRAYDENRVLVTYYAGPPGALSIHAARVSLQ